MSALATPSTHLSYHLLDHVAAQLVHDSTPLTAVGQLRRAVASCLRGFVSHDAYHRSSRVAAAARPGSRRIEQALRDALACDLNPIAALLREANDVDNFHLRWNGFNRQVRLGVQTTLADAPAMQRELKTGKMEPPDDGSRLREELIAQCIALLRTEAGHGQQHRGPDLPATAHALGLQHTAAAELIALLDADPAHDLYGCARELGCSTRTLQRQLGDQQLPFASIRQAIRLSTAAYRLRHEDESISATAQASGYFDAAHMIHAWTRACAMTPSAYRRMARYQNNN